MSKMGDNDDQVVMVYDTTGNAITAVQWEEARHRIVAWLAGDGTSNPGALETEAEGILCTMFSGRPYQAEAA